MSCIAYMPGYACTSNAIPTLCTPGYYSTSTTNYVCTACPIGSYCPTTDVDPIVCDDGYYSAAKATGCSPCPGGILCSKTGGLSSTCDAGYWLAPLTNAGSCSDCSEGKYCYSGAVAETLCPPGTYSTVRSSTCTLCEDGFMCPSSLTSARTACLAGTYSVSGSLSCSPCPDGYACPSSSTTFTTIVACGVGKYPAADKQSCLSCDAGKACPSGHSATIANCPVGTYSDTGASLCTFVPENQVALNNQNSLTACSSGQYILNNVCTDCPTGKYCPNPRSDPILCRPGTYAATPPTICKVCEAGYQCPNGDPTQRTACNDGWYALPGSIACIQCPVGSFCPSKTVPLVKKCDAGYYSPTAGASSCIQCPANNRCKDKKTANPCPTHFYSLQGWGECRPCPAGQTCTGASTPSDCSAGTYSPEGNKDCLNCPAGSYCPVKSSAPRLCVPGTAQPNPNQASCLACNSGEYSVAGATSCVPCPAGFYCPSQERLPIKCPLGTYTSTTSQTSCQKCSDGYICSPGSTSQTPATDLCPLGFYCKIEYVNSVQRTTYYPCPEGYYGTSEGENSLANACTKCPAGTYCPLQGMINPFPCPKGGYCPKQSTTPTYCSAGTYNPKIESSSSSDCLTCPGGNTCAAGSWEPLLCDAGSYCAGGAATAVQCPAGTYSSLSPITTSTNCMTCPAGSYCPIGSFKPIMCPPGTYNTLTGKAQLNECLNCSAGKACPKYGNIKDIGVPCLPGYYCPVGTAYLTQYPCVAGTYSNETGATSSAVCLTCPKGWACTGGTNSFTNPMVICPAGYFCPDGTDSPTKNACPGGKYQPFTGMTTSSACLYSCPSGSYCPAGSSKPAGLCSDGYYCPEGSASSTANPCSAGTYSTGTGLRTQTECTICPAGYYCPAGSSSATRVMCSKGTYNPATGKGLATDCLSCSAGYYCPIDGSTSQTECSYGKYSDVRAIVCLTCTLTFYCNESALPKSKIDSLTVACEAGYICPNGVSEYPSESLLCPEGRYCLARAVDSTPCPPGTYYPYKGGKQLLDCITTPAGKYSLRGSAVPTGDCAPGFYCPAASTRDTMVPCPAGSFRSKPNGAVQADCGVCPAGYFCPIGTANPRSCLAGFYCPTGSSIPTRCSPGYFGASPLLRQLSQCTKCWSGRYCSVSGLSLPDGNCDPGYYCQEGSTNPNPTDGTTGNLCPAGGVCPAGSKTPQPCLPGTFSSTAGMKSTSECLTCTAGKYCLGEVKNGVSGSCSAGYYCPAGAKTNKEVAASPGYYTAAGASIQTKCAAGTYTPNQATVTCTSCPAGYKCPTSGNTGTFTDCDNGKYCVTGSSAGTSCPAGTYGPNTNLRSSSACSPCPDGKYCTGGASTSTANCNAGYYCDGGSSTGTPSTKTCPTGSFCPAGTGKPIPCPIGTFSSGTSKTIVTDCVSCTAGSYCSKNGLTGVEGQCDVGYNCNGGDTLPRPDTKKCTAGQMCPKGSTVPIDCPAGTYQDSVAQGGCYPCPRGYYCPAKSTAFIPNQDCPQGYYCPEGTGSAYDNACPAGTYNPVKNGFHISSCLPCSPGKYCAGTGRILDGVSCDPGYYCIRGSSVSNPTATVGGKCLKGTYCPAGTSYPVSCPPGYACTTDGMSTYGAQCSAGFYCTLGAISVAPTGAAEGGGPCPSGFYCPTGSSGPIPCPAGTYSTATGIISSSQCTLCDDGWYCESPGATAKTAQCSAGYACKKAWNATIGYTNPKPYAMICSRGYYCPTGATDMLPCPSTSYQDTFGQATCKICPAGYYCDADVMHLCTPSQDKISYYCPGSSRTWTRCSAGYYNVQDGSKSSSDCLACPPGKYCPYSPGTTESKINSCPAGKYCPSGSAAGITCDIGYYCPAGIAEEMKCPPGKYCDAAGLTENDITTKVCDAGYWCIEGSPTKTPTDGILGKKCPTGYYCPQGCLEPIGCPPGTYRNLDSGTSVASCLACPSTKYCQSRGLSAVGIACPAGYYCPISTSQSKKYPCQAGYKCPAGSSSQTLCPINTYQPLPVQSTCTNCPARYYCLNTVPADAIKPKICPAGKYCTAAAQPFNCPKGTFSSNTGLASSSECFKCPPGKICDSLGLTSVTKDCTAGYYCIGGVLSDPPPTNDATAKICPAGHFCPAGSASPTMCPPGTINDITGSTTSAACINCPARYYCPYRAGSSTMYNIGVDGSFYCYPGYLCFSGSTIPNPTDGTKGRICDVGKYCVAGALAEVNCDLYTFNPYQGKGSCFSCPAGRYCNVQGMSSYIDCPNGYYCPGGVDKVPCPAGTYFPGLNIDNVSSCYDCDPGYYCTGGKSAPDAHCSDGYVCPRGAKFPTSSTQFNWATPSKEGLCPPGHYCLAGSKAPTPCEIGTYQDQYGQTSCKDCPVGRYCDVIGIGDLSTFLCQAGHYCTGKATTKAPKSFDEGGRVCNEGYYCPAGTLVEVPCPFGTYEPREGSAVCQPCPAGFYCSADYVSTFSVEPIECSINSYCPPSSPAPILCPSGTYSKIKGLQSVDQCRPCPSGLYCTLGKIQGNCAAGYYCDAGASSATDPTKPCPAGHYCLTGTSLPTVCPEGKVRLTPGAAANTDCIDCTAGYFCIATVPTPIECPKGHYCPAASNSPTPCPNGYYVNQTMKTVVGDCLLCPPGFDCSEKGIADPNGFRCPVGSYCPNSANPPVLCPNGTFNNVTGLSNVSGCKPCPEGYYCLNGTISPILCDEGMDCQEGSNSQQECPAGFYCIYTAVKGGSYAKRQGCPGGYYCPKKTIFPIKCENGYYCPPFSATPTPCPGGAMGINVESNDAITTGCANCPPGTFSIKSESVSINCWPCTPGYVCISNTSSDKPVDPNKDGGYECPKGFYCPEGSYEPTPCTQGYFNKDIRATSISSCMLCEEDYYNDLEGQQGCKPCGPTSFARMGSITCTCKGNNRVFQKADGKCVCKQYYASVLDNDEEDSDRDCRPLLLERCANGYLRDSTGKCVPQGDCAKECKGKNGKRTPGIGLCECEEIEDPDFICNSTCRSNTPKMYIDTTGHIVFENKTAVNMNNVVGVAGEPQCIVQPCKLVSMSMKADGGFSSNYGPSTKLVTAARSQKRLTKDEARRLLQASTAGITNPAICIRVGDTISFDVNAVNYPVYMKDAMANSNQDFDYTGFTELASRMTAGETITLFLYTFNQAGVYVFADNFDKTQMSIISVMDKSQVCPDTDKYIVPITASNLLMVGVRQNEAVNLVPDWAFIGCCFIVMLMLIPGVVVFLSYFHNRALDTKSLILAKKQSKKPVNVQNTPLDTAKTQEALASGRQATEEALIPEKHVIEMEKEESEEGEIDPSIFADIYKQLTEHVGYVKSEFERKSDQDSDNIQQAWENMKVLKRFIKVRLTAIAKIFGKNVKYMLNSVKRKKCIINKEMKQNDAEGDKTNNEVFEEDESERIEVEKAVFKEAIKNRIVADAQELEKLKADNNDHNKDFMKRFVEMQNRRLDEFKEKTLENSKLTDGDKRILLKEYETQLQNMQKQLMLDQAEEQNQLKLVMEARGIKRELLIAHKEMLEKQKEKVKQQTANVLKQMSLKIAEVERNINADIDSKIRADEESINKRYKEDTEKLRAKFDKILNKTSDPQRRAQILEEFELASKELERIYVEEKNGKLKDIKSTLEKHRQEIKEKSQKKADEERESVIKISQEQLDKIKEEENMIYNKLVNDAILEKVTEAKDSDTFKAKEEAQRLESLRESKAEELKKIDKEEKDKLNAIRDEDQKEEDAIRLENEKKKTIVMTASRRSCEDLQEKRKKLVKELADAIGDEKKTALQEEIQKIEDEMKKRVEEDLKKHHQEFNQKLELLKKKRVDKESKLKQAMANARTQIEEKYEKLEANLRQEIREGKFRRALEDLKARMSNEELPIAVEKLFEDKHMEELSDLLAEQYREKAKLMSEKMGEMIEKRLMEMHNVKMEMEKEYGKLKELRDNEQTSDDAYSRRLKEIQEREYERIRNIELDYIQKGNDIEHALCKEITDKSQIDLVKLREGQLKQKNEYMLELAKSNHFARNMLTGGPNSTVSEELEEYKKQLNDAKEKRLKDLENRKARLEEIALENEGKIKAFNDETQKLLDELAKREMEKMERKRHELQELKRKHESNLSVNEGISEEEKQKMLAEYCNEYDALLKAMQEEQKRQAEFKAKKLEERWSAKEKLKNQKQFQLAMYKREVEDNLNNQIKEMQINLDTKVEAKDAGNKITVLIAKTDNARRLFYKKKYLAGVDYEEISKLGDIKALLEKTDEDDELEDAPLNVDFDGLLNSIAGLRAKVAGFSDGNLVRLMDGFRTINAKLTELKAKALAKAKN